MEIQRVLVALWFVVALCHAKTVNNKKSLDCVGKSELDDDSKGNMELDALRYLISLEPLYSSACNLQMTTRWNYITNVTTENEAASTQADTEYLKFQSKIQSEILSKFPNWAQFKDPLLKREFKYLSIRGPATMSPEAVANRTQLLGKMESKYSTATVCEYKNASNCHLRLDPEISQKLRTTEDYDELAYYWTAWHDAMNKAVKPSDYTTFMSYESQMAKANGFKDMSEMWLAGYDDETPGWTAIKFKQEMLRIWEELRPYYNLLHGYVRMKLRQKSPFSSKIKRYGYLPAHIMGNMWSQDWGTLDKYTKPYPNAPSLDATDAMVAKNYTVRQMFEIADKFFTDLGLLPMTQTFWEKSMLERPADGRDVVCHASAEDFCLGRGSTDFRIKECTRVTMDDLVTVHHEMGHIEYFMQYTHENYVFRDGANPGFHEAIGDALALAVTTPKHLQCVLGLPMGLNLDCTPTNFTNTENAGTVTETDINYLYITALQKFVFFPFAISMDSWRWEVFEGKLNETQYNKRWWELRKRNQGIVPPSHRPDDVFDAAAKYHVVANVPYIRYFVSHILQFQFYEAMCKASGEFTPNDPKSKPLYQCDFSGSKAAGKLLGDMMKLGFTKGWPRALEVITGSPNMSVKPLLFYFKPLFDLMKKEMDAAGEQPCFGAECQSFAKEYIEKTYETEASAFHTKVANAEWASTTNLSNTEADTAAQAANVEYSNFEKQKWKDHFSQFDVESFANDSTKRQLVFLNEVGTSALSEPELVLFNKISAHMTKVYGQSKVCPFNNTNCNVTSEGLSLNPHLEDILAGGKSYDEMAYVWKAWREASGRPIRDNYTEFVCLNNKAAVENGYKDMGKFWLRRYETPSFRNDLGKVWQDVRGLYAEFQAYIRYKLTKKFPQINATEPLPEHIFGNMWAQSWEHLYKHVVPFPDAPSFDVTEVLKEKFKPDLEGVTQMFEVANDFFLSIGLSDMKMAYGPKAVIVKPTDRDVVCHASAWDFADGKDYRVKMCTKVTMEDFITIHHELGHIQYYLNYKNLSLTFRSGANPGFHEAIGDVVALSVATPKHMAAINYLNSTQTSNASTINYLMQMALEKIAFLPFGYLIDNYRWRIFEGSIGPNNYTYAWMKMRNEYQGIVPPFKRSEQDFDAGSKYHVPGNTPYIRYFVSFILQFQIHKALCTAAGEYPKNPLHECDIYQNKIAGEKFKKLLEYGASRPWQETLLEITGEDKLDASAIKEYFKPLSTFLKSERERLKYPVGWRTDAFKEFYDNTYPPSKEYC